MKELFKHVSLYAGIGGFNLAADVMGWETVCSVENSEFCQTVLNYYWKNSKIYGDITRSKFHEFNGTIDIVSAGFPCQPFSVSGKRKGTDDHRNLWPETNRAISEIKPPFFVGENVSGLLSWDGGTVADTIKHDLEDQGYTTFFILFPALAIGANNIRERLWIVAYSESILRQRDYSKYRSCDKKEQAKKRFSQGNPRFTAWMMHYPLRFTEFPFQNGGGKPNEHTATL
jgi:DNA (cytosine-5)-methyltransferase 1